MEQKTQHLISISRQLGSGGAYVGQQLAKRLNIVYIDREIICKAAQKFSVLEEDLESRDEKVLSYWQSFIQISALSPDVYVPPQKRIIPTDFELFKAETEIIRHFAKEHSSVIIGRCGFHILRDYPNHVSIFLHGDVASRSKRIQNLYNITEKEADKMIAQSDKDRAFYINTFTGKEWTDAREYDLSIDTGKIDVDKSVELILNYLKIK
ncbi:MAG: cytidylate kinase-like family protein [Bacteroidota bacterium]|nr:cytidylate kinase-like family protein [Bacteroidota bacterium]